MYNNNLKKKKTIYKLRYLKKKKLFEYSILFKISSKSSIVYKKKKKPTNFY